MSHFFDDVYDTEPVEQVEQEVIAPEEEDNPWFKKDTGAVEEDGQQATANMSKAEKFAHEAEELSDKIDMFLDVDLKGAFDFYNELKGIVEKKSTSLQIPIRFFQLVDNVREWIASQEMEAKDQEDEDEDAGMTKEERAYCKKLEKLNKDLSEKYRMEIERARDNDFVEPEAQQQEEAEAQAGEEKWSEEKLIEYLQKATTEKQVTVTLPTGEKRSFPRARMCQIVLSTANQRANDEDRARKSFAVNIQIAANALLSAITVEDCTSTHIHAKEWRRAFDSLRKAFEIAQKSKNLGIIEQDSLLKIDETHTVVNGGFSRMAEELHRELIRAFQFTSIRDAGIDTRLQDEKRLLSFLDVLASYYEERKSKRHFQRCASCIMDIISPWPPAVFKKAEYIGIEKMKTVDFENSAASLKSLHGSILQSTPDKVPQATATLQLAYHLAITDNYQAACDIILQTRIHESVQAAPDAICVLYNRVLAQVGLCAFRCGKYAECNSILSDLCSRRDREVPVLLGQDTLRSRDDTAEVELENRDRLVPPHHHISVDLIEACSLLSAMLVGLVAEAKKPNAPIARSKHFQRVVNSQNYSVVTGKPGDHKEAVYVAYRALQEQDFVTAISTVSEMKIWSFIADAKETQARLVRRIREDSLRVFLVTCGTSYSSLTVDHLSSKYGLEPADVRGIVSQLLLERDSPIVGFWDHEESCLTIERGNPSKMDHLVELCAERLSYLTVGSQPAAFKAKGRGRGRWTKSH